MTMKNNRKPDDITAVTGTRTKDYSVANYGKEVDKALIVNGIELLKWSIKPYNPITAGILNSKTYT